ncbi:acyl-CoA dehydrogenase family protein [Actinomadura sp. SCN-SB]|uniref:acyl-CoA dehydrogenase family protein n=1 Tax=Actinomadura sp. SCN-SB TaxID=3373092 RepID=UPI00375185CD
MRFRFDADHDDLREAVRRPLADSPPGACDARAAVRLAREIGVYGLCVPERFGGGGFGMLELGVVFQEAGRAAFDAPLLSPVLAADLLLPAASFDSGSDVAADLLARIAAGELVAAPAIAEGPLGWDCTPATTATPSSAPSASTRRWRLSGVKDWVQDGMRANRFIVSARTADGPALFAVAANEPGLTVEPVESIDISRRFARLRLDGASAALLPVKDATAAVRRTRDRGLALLSADNVGVTGRCLEMATSWAKERSQFGQVIGSFQAIKHKLADVRLELEAAESACLYALWAAQEAPSELPAVARIAAHTCGEAALLAAEENIQVHGGIGATWEHPAHVYLRRATAGRRLLADPQALLEDLARIVEETVFVSTAVLAR